MNINSSLSNIKNKLSRSQLADLSLDQWMQILPSQCMVYRLNEQYLIKSFEEISYRLCSEDTAITILSRNLNVLLIYYYFPHPTDDEIDIIENVISYFTKHIDTFVLKVKFEDEDASGIYMESLPSYCVAFNNGVYDFKNGKWFFQYQITPIDDTKSLITYPEQFKQYRIMWNINRDFNPKIYDGIPLNVLSFDEWLLHIKELDKENPSKFFRLFYNMSYDSVPSFSSRKALHLAEILGYLLYAPFVQQFVFFLGEGSNGKDSLFDAFYRECIVPIPTSNSAEDLEKDRFVMSSLTSVGQNICSETETGVLSHSAILKQLTGSQFQTIEEKGVDKYVGYLNCKFVFAANNKDQIMFKDSSTGFKRRINVYECYFQWDEKKKFLQTFPGSYDSTYQNTSELREGDGLEEFFITAMYGIKEATSNFTKPFHFTINDYDENVNGLLDEDFINKINKLNAKLFIPIINNLWQQDQSKIYDGFYSDNKIKLCKEIVRPKGEGIPFSELEGDTFRDKLINDFNKFGKYDEYGNSEEAYFEDVSCIYISMDLFYLIGNNGESKSKFSREMMDNFQGNSNFGRFIRIGANKLYVQVYFDEDGNCKIGKKY